MLTNFGKQEFLSQEWENRSFLLRNWIDEFRPKKYKTNIRNLFSLSSWNNGYKFDSTNMCVGTVNTLVNFNESGSYCKRIKRYVEVLFFPAVSIPVEDINLILLHPLFNRGGGQIRVFSIKNNWVLSWPARKELSFLAKNELNALSKYGDGQQIPRLIWHDKNIYVRELLDGQSIPHSSLPFLGKRIFKLLADRVYKPSLKTIETGFYIQQRYKSIKKLNKKSSSNKVEKASVILDELITLFPNEFLSSDLYTCESHGDLAPKNVLSNNGEIVLIDWEHSMRFNILYDLSNMCYKTKYYQSIISGFNENENYVSNWIDVINSFALNEWTKVKYENVKWYYLIFLIERLELQYTKYGDQEKLWRFLTNWNEKTQNAIYNLKNCP